MKVEHDGLGVYQYDGGIAVFGYCGVVANSFDLGTESFAALYDHQILGLLHTVFKDDLLIDIGADLLLVFYLSNRCIYPFSSGFGASSLVIVTSVIPYIAFFM